MDRRELLIVLGVGPLAAPLACFAQPQRRVWRIGMLDTVAPKLNAANLEAFHQGMRELGYVEGRNLIIEYRSADGRGARFPDLATELVGLKVDLIVTRGTPAALAAKNATRTIPVVMVHAGDPVGSGLVTTLAHPGGNVTGLSSATVDLETKRFELLRELVPRIARVAALYDMSNPNNARQWKAIETAARAMGVQSQLLDVRKAEDLEAAFAAASKQRADGLVVGGDDLMTASRNRIAELAAAYRLPAIYRSEFIEAGGLMAYGPNDTDFYRRTATYIDRIFKGAKPSELPVEQPTKFELIINLKAARALGLTIPQSLSLRADKVIQ